MSEAERIATLVRRNAWGEVLNTPSGRIVMADILARCRHWQVAQDAESRVLQQFAIELLRASGLYSEESGSFPVDYVSMLTRTKLTTVPGAEKPQTWLGRLLGRNPNV